MAQADAGLCHGELASDITQGFIAMVSLPVLVAGLLEAACRLKENINLLDFSYTACQILPIEGLSKAVKRFNTNQRDSNCES